MISPALSLSVRLHIFWENLKYDCETSPPVSHFQPAGSSSSLSSSSSSSSISPSLRLVSLSLSLSVSLSGLHSYEFSPLKVALLIQILIMNGTELWLRYGHLCVCSSVYPLVCVCVGEREKVPDWWEVMTRSSALPSSITLSFRALWPSTFSLKLWNTQRSSSESET